MVSWGNCRYYENELPELNQVVMVNIKQVCRKSFRPQGDDLPLFLRVMDEANGPPPSPLRIPNWASTSSSSNITMRTA